MSITSWLASPEDFSFRQASAEVSRLRPSGWTLIGVKEKGEEEETG